MTWPTSLKAEQTLYSPPVRKVLGDYLPSPPFTKELILTHGRKLHYPGRHIYAFSFTGGPLTPGYLGCLSWGSKTLEAHLISPPGPELIFLTPESWPLAETDGRAKWEPNEDPWLPLSESPGVPGLSEFSDPASGWLSSVNDLCFKPADFYSDFNRLFPAWEALPDSPPRLGVSFVWDNLDRLAQTILGLTASLPPEESLWVLSDREDILAMAAGALKNQPRDILVLGPALNETLAEAELSHLLALKSSQKAEELASLRSKLDFQRSIEKNINIKLQKWEYLRTIEEDLERLNREVAYRETVWAFHSGELSAAREDWTKSRQEKSFWSFFKRKKTDSEKKLAAVHLEAAETEMTRVRREKTSLLAEAKKLTEKLTALKEMVKTLPSALKLKEELRAIAAECQKINTEIGDKVLSFSPVTESRKLLRGRPAVIAFPGWATSENLADFGQVDNLLVLSPSGYNVNSRKALALLAAWPYKRLIIAGDFSTWFWGNETEENPSLKESPIDIKRPEVRENEIQDKKPQKPEEALKKPKAWSSYLTPTPETRTQSPLRLLSPLPETALTRPPKPDKFPWLAELGIKSALNIWSWPGPWGPVWQAAGENGPVNPVSALASVNLALTAKKLSPNAPVYILAPSPAQGALLRAFIGDLAPQVTGLSAGDISELADFPPAALVIADTAQGLKHPWSWPGSGRQALLEAVRLTEGALVFIGHDKQIKALPPLTPLTRLWSAGTSVRPNFKWPPQGPLTMWEALDKAQREAFFCLPVFEPGWWTPLSVHFQSALNRQVKITVLAAVPSEAHKEYCGTVLRDLKLYGAQVILAQGFSDLTGLIDQKYFTWGEPGPSKAGRPDWTGLWTVDTPKAGSCLSQIIQAPLIAEKLGPKGFRNCPQCGWPYLLLNKAQLRDFDHRQPLRLGCLNPGCPNHHRPRRLDERWPFLNPPICEKNRATVYVREPKGKSEIWVCPEHEDCPHFKVIPGDAVSKKF
ncbi:MAG: hypothetical protein LBP22_07330 [Deltaproteobacteria bacterium]|jgi:hypothetical protein|nr:hypothetical protein [Deltaproteobacteria bacterium]